MLMVGLVLGTTTCLMGVPSPTFEHVLIQMLHFLRFLRDVCTVRQSILPCSDVCDECHVWKVFHINADTHVVWWVSVILLIYVLPPWLDYAVDHDAKVIESGHISTTSRLMCDWILYLRTHAASCAQIITT